MKIGGTSQCGLEKLKGPLEGPFIPHSQRVEESSASNEEYLLKTTVVNL